MINLRTDGAQTCGRIINQYVLSNDVSDLSRAKCIWRAAGRSAIISATY